MQPSAAETPMDAPWMKRKDWACGWIHSGGVAELVLWWVVAGVWNGFMLILIAVFWGDPEYDDAVKVVALFELIGLGILIFAVQGIFQRRQLIPCPERTNRSAEPIFRFFH